MLLSAFELYQDHILGEKLEKKNESWKLYMAIHSLIVIILTIY